jgi:SAM-dependent methyltransferase
MCDNADRIIDLYERHAQHWDRNRTRNLFERPWLDHFRALLPAGGCVLDIGCGCGEPIARTFIEAGYRVTGVDSSRAMARLCAARFPDETWVVVDMRALSLDARFNGILAWDSFFHLTPEDQRAMFPIFRRHAASKAALMFTSGPRAGVAMGTYEGEPLYHASLDPQEYRALLDEHGFEVVSYVPEDRACGGRTIWLARLDRP